MKGPEFWLVCKYFENINKVPVGSEVMCKWSWNFKLNQWSALLYSKMLNSNGGLHVLWICSNYYSDNERSTFKNKFYKNFSSVYTIHNIILLIYLFWKSLILRNNMIILLLRVRESFKTWAITW